MNKKVRITAAVGAIINLVFVIVELILLDDISSMLFVFSYRKMFVYCALRIIESIVIVLCLLRLDEDDKKHRITNYLFFAIIIGSIFKGKTTCEMMLNYYIRGYHFINLAILIGLYKSDMEIEAQIFGMADNSMRKVKQIMFKVLADLFSVNKET